MNTTLAPDTTAPHTDARAARLHAEMLRDDVTRKRERLAQRITERPAPVDDAERRIYAARDANARSQIKRAIRFADAATVAANALMEKSA